MAVVFGPAYVAALRYLLNQGAVHLLPRGVSLASQGNGLAMLTRRTVTNRLDAQLDRWLTSPEVEAARSHAAVIAAVRNGVDQATIETVDPSSRIVVRSRRDTRLDRAQTQVVILR
jgi:hypothetical protein